MSATLPRPHLRWSYCILGGAVIIHLLMMASLFWGFLDSAFSLTDTDRQAIDFFSVYEAGHRALENESVYVGAVDSVTPYSVFYRYVPMFAYGFAVPLNAVPPWWAYWGWVAFYEVLLVVNAYVTWRVAGRGTWAIVAAAMWFVFTPFYVEQFQGQFSFLMATALFLVGIGVLRRTEKISALPWIVSLVIKTNSALLVPVFLHLKWWRTVAVGTAFLALNGVYFLWRPEDKEFFYNANVGTAVEQSPVRDFAFSAHELGGAALLRSSFLTADSTATGVPTSYMAALVVTVVAISLCATFLARNPDALGLFAIWMSSFLLFYGSWEHHYLMLLPALVLLVAFRPQIRLLALVAFVLIAMPTPYWLLKNVWSTGPFLEDNPAFNAQNLWPAWGVILYHMTKSLPVAVLWAFLVAGQLRGGVSLPQFLLLTGRRCHRARTLSR